MKSHIGSSALNLKQATSDGNVSNALRESVSRDVKKLSVLKPYKTYFAVAFDWAVIFVAILTSMYFSSVGVYIFSAFIIGARQHSLLIIMHEAAHKRISNNLFLNDFIGDFFAAIPVFMGVAGYRAHHMQHHFNLNTEKDPDWARKSQLNDWQFPMSQKEFAVMITKYLFLGGSIKEWGNLVLIFSGLSSITEERTIKSLKPLFIRIVFYGGITGLVCHFGHWSYLLLYWLAPYLFVMLLFQRIRSIAEHFGTSRDHELSDSRNVITSGFEAFFLGPHNVNYHLDHHIFPSVPFYNLPSLHQKLKQHDEYRTHAHLNTSYIWPTENSLLKDIISEKPSGGIK
ncbi:MAG: fatty acid desaturase family protein [Bdellovibrionota bacterium]